jgi:hypothetical protein
MGATMARKAAGKTSTVAPRRYSFDPNPFKPAEPSPEIVAAFYPDDKAAAPVPAVSPPLVANETWFATARKAHPRRRGEKTDVYARRLWKLMQTAPVNKPWKSWKTARRRLYER